MTECIKCGKSIPDGQLFCQQCSKIPVIAELNHSSAPKPAPRRPAPASAPAPRPTSTAPKASASPKLKKAFIGLCAAFAVVLVLFIVQQGKQLAKENRLRTQQDNLAREAQEMEETRDQLADCLIELEDLEKELKEKEAQIKELSAQLADSQSVQNQGQYDLSNLQKEYDALKEDYDTLKEEHDRMVEAVEAAAKYKDKATFLDQYVVFVVNNGTNLYHTYDCADFAKSNFWTYSPKLAEAQGFRPCPKCSGS